MWRLLENARAHEKMRGLEKRYLDADSHTALAARLGVRGLPALLVLKQGQVIARAPADPAIEELLVWLNGVEE